MNTELSLAIEELASYSTDKPWFIPVLLSKCKIPDFPITGNRTLRDLHYVELYKDWDGGVDQIIEAIISSDHKCSMKNSDTTMKGVGTWVGTRRPIEYVPQVLWDTLWSKYMQAKTESNKRELLKKLLENGDPRACEELRRLPRSPELLWAAKMYPIPEYVEVAIESLGGENNNALTALEFLRQAEKLIPLEIEPEHLASVVGIADYLATSQDCEMISFLGSLIYFLKAIGEQNPSLQTTCGYIVLRILNLDLHPSTISDCLAALSNLKIDQKTESKWRIYCLKELERCTPAERWENSFFNSDASYYLEGLCNLSPGPDSEKIINEAIRFLVSKDIDEIYNALRLLVEVKATIPSHLANDIDNRIDQLSHSYTDSMISAIRRLLASLNNEQPAL